MLAVQGLPVGARHRMLGDWRGGENVEIVPRLQRFLDDLHVEQAEEATAEAEAERQRVFGFVDERGVVQFQPVEGIAQQRVVIALYREETGEDHRLGLPIPWQWGVGCRFRHRDGITHLAILYVLKTRGHLSYLSRPIPRDRHKPWRTIAPFEHIG